jgi:hypothetical protein
MTTAIAARMPMLPAIRQFILANEAIPANSANATRGGSSFTRRLHSARDVLWMFDAAISAEAAKQRDQEIAQALSQEPSAREKLEMIAEPWLRCSLK